MNDAGVVGEVVVGRDAELAALAGLLADADAGRGRVALVLGEAGIGKTSVAETFAATAAESGAQLAWGRCPAAEAPAYWPWTQILSDLVGEAARGLLERGQFGSRPELFAAVAEAIETACRAGAVLVILEDAHWADAGSLALLEFLAGVTAGRRLMLLVTARDDDPVPVLSGAGTGVRRIELPGLDQAATEALVRRIVGEPTTPEYLSEVYRRSGGNPFFAQEVARLQASRGSPAGAVPAGVRQVLEHRLARLHQDSFSCLQLAAVIGSPDVRRLAVVSGQPEDEVLRLLEAPERAHIVVGRQRGYAFAHDLLRETLYQAMSATTRAKLHRQVAERSAGAGAAELARHWSLAAGEDARAHAAEFAATAGDEAATALSHEQAVDHYRTALELGGGADISVRRRLGEAQVHGGQIVAGRETLHAAAQAAQDAGDAENLARAVLAMGGGIGGFEVDVVDPEQAPLLTEALRLLPPQDSPLRAAVLARLSLSEVRTSTVAERAAVAGEAVAMAGRLGDAESEVAALAALCDAQAGPDFVDDRIAAADRMMVLASGHALLELLARRIRLLARLERGDLAGVDADIAGYARTAARLRSPTYTWLVPLWRGMRAEMDGDLATAEAYAEEVATLADDAGSTNANMMAWALRWRVARKRGDKAVIAEAAVTLGAWSENFPAVDCPLALIFAESGDPERGRRHVRRLMAAGLDAVPKDSEWLETLWMLGEAAMILDERDAARAVHTALEPYAELWAVDGYGGACFGQVSDLLERLAAYDGRPHSRAIPDARAAFRRTGAVWQLEFRGERTTVVDSKGMRDLAVLLAAPGREVHVLDLVQASGGPPRAAAAGDTGPALDADARTAYRRRLGELESEIDEADADHDQGRADTLRAEQEFLLAELSSALGLGGRPRLSGDRTERARKAVTMRIGTAQKAIHAVDPDLARHLRNSVSTGRFCSYRPDQPVGWQTS